MRIELRDGSVLIEGYVNAVERLSKPLPSPFGTFVERIKAGCFKRALRRNAVKILLNHDNGRKLGDTNHNLELYEDSIGLHARAEITDAEVMRKAKRGELSGWSFGFRDINVTETEEEGMPCRNVNDLELLEVSILDRSKTPAYDGTLITARDEAGNTVHMRDGEQEERMDLTKEQIDQIAEACAEAVIAKMAEQAPEDEPEDKDNDKPDDGKPEARYYKELEASIE